MSLQFIDKRLLAVLRRNFFPLVFAVWVCGSVFPTIDFILKSYQDRNYLSFTVYCVFLFVLIWMGFLLRPKSKPPLPPKRGVFLGVQNPEKIGKGIWKRENDTARIRDAVLGSKNRPLVLVGASGAGKSVLIYNLLPESLNKGGAWKIISFADYVNCEHRIAEKLDACLTSDVDRDNKKSYSAVKEKNTGVLFVFDQFEQFVSEKINDASVQKWLKDLLRQISAIENVRVLIVVRKEWFYDLKFLGEFAPAPAEAVYLSGFRRGSKESEAAYGALRDSFCRILPENKADVVLDSLFAGAEILPVEAQMVGLILENDPARNALDKEYYFKTLGGKTGMIEKYFRSYLQASPNSSITLKVLFCLSVKTEMRKQQDAGTIAKIIHEDSADVQECLDFLTTEGLVSLTSDRRFELAHDYLAYKFHEFSGLELEPVDRDNILFFWDEAHRENGGAFVVTQRHNRRLVISDYLFLGVVLVFIMRLLGPRYGLHWEWFDTLPQYRNISMGMDVYFFPIAVAHLAWAVYVTFLYHRFISNIPENFSGRFFSAFMLLVCAGCNILTAFNPLYWILFIGIGGFSVALKYYQLAVSLGFKNINSRAFRYLGNHTSCQMFVLMAIGLAAARYVRWNPSETVMANFNIISVVIAVILTLGMLSLFPGQVSWRAASTLMGLSDRSRVRSPR